MTLRMSLPSEVEIDPKRQRFIDSDDPGCERGFNPALCQMRHTVARLKEARGMRHEYEPCAYCPKFLAPVEENTPAAIPPESQKPVEQPQAIPEKPKETKKMRKIQSQFKCKCGAPISAQRANNSGKCKTCYQRDYNSTYKGKLSQGEKPKKVLPDMPASKLCKDHNIQSCHNCEDLSCGDNLNKAEVAPKTGAEKSICNETAPKVTQEKTDVTFEPAADTIHASWPPKDLPSAKLVIPIQEIDVCRRAINQYGILRQMAKAAEEFAEAAAAINRHMATEGSHEEIISELADVEVMCVQLRMILGASAIDQQRAEKVARLHGRLKP